MRLVKALRRFLEGPRASDIIFKSEANSRIKLAREYKTGPNGELLFRVQAIIGFPEHGVSPGDRGGWVESVDQVRGRAWVGEEAMLLGGAVIGGDTHLSGTEIVTPDTIIVGNEEVQL